MSAWKRLHGLQNEGAVNINTVLRTELCRGLSHNLVALCNDLRAGAQHSWVFLAKAACLPGHLRDQARATR